jgi:hypothetical protein
MRPFKERAHAFFRARTAKVETFNLNITRSTINAQVSTLTDQPLNAHPPTLNNKPKPKPKN